MDLIEDTSPDIPDRVAKGQVIVLGRSYSEGVLRIIQKIHGWGGKVVFDLDDNFFDISPYSPHYNDLGIMAMNLDRPDGSSVPMWEDGK
ncbi:MAG TPA: hypothetical protein VLA34_06060, partial [Candidatus Krumholzibacterium sp.]|nr:hypothetical protein [Candidatus Krumholzibacterium sp.]